MRHFRPLSSLGPTGRLILSRSLTPQPHHHSDILRTFALELRIKDTLMSIDTYKLTSMEEPTDEVLAQLMHEAAEEASRTNREATTRFFEEIKQAAAAY